MSRRAPPDAAPPERHIPAFPAHPQRAYDAAMSRGRLIFYVAIVAAFVASQATRSRDRPAKPRARTSASDKYTATVPEGLGASVAILLDNSGSMEHQPSTGGGTAKYRIARDVLGRVLAQTDSFVARQTGFPVNVGLYVFNRRVTRVLPIAPYDRDRLRAALARIGDPGGGTAIGDAMEEAIPDLYAAGTFRKYLMVITDGENTNGRSPSEVAREIADRSEGSVRLMLVAFDVDPRTFGFVSEVRGTLVEARDAGALQAGLDTLYRGRILAEAVDAGEASPGAPGAGAGTPRDTSALRPQETNP